MTFQASFSSLNRGPLTTIYTPPATCLDVTTLSSGTSGDYWLFQGHYNWGDADCYPPTIATSQGTELWGHYYYSPGFCPQGWTSATSQEVSAAGFETTLASSITAALCCPSGWYAYGGADAAWTSHGCSKAWASGVVLTSVWDAPTTYTFDEPYTNPSNKTYFDYTLPGDASAVCDGIPIMWQNTDTAILELLGQATTTTSSTSSSSTSVASTSPTTSIPTSTSTTTSNFTPVASSGLSTGAKAGLGIAIPLLVISLLTFIFFFIRRRKQRQIAAANWRARNYDPLGNGQDKYEPVLMQQIPQDPQELDEAAHIMPEMGTGREAQELYATPTARNSQPRLSPYRNRVPLGTQQQHNQPASEPLLRNDSGDNRSDRLLEQLSSQPGSQARIDELRARIGRVRAEGFELTESQNNDLEVLEKELRGEVLALARRNGR